MSKLRYYAALIGALISSTVLAGDPVTLNITGNVVASPCEISSDSITKTIDLGGGSPIQASTLQTAGSSTPWIPFTIGLVNCPAGTTAVVALFHGTPDTNNPGDRYKNSGTAGNVSIQLLTTDEEWWAGDGRILGGTITNNSYTYKLKTRAYSYGNVTPGTISAVVTITFTYQ